MNIHYVSDGIWDIKGHFLFPISLPQSLYPQATPESKENAQNLREDLGQDFAIIWHAQNSEWEESMVQDSKSCVCLQ